MFLFLLHLLALPVFAQDASPTSTITPSPTPTISLTLSLGQSSVTTSESFPVKLVINNAKSNAAYYFKVFGGPSSANCAVQVLTSASGWVGACDGAWSGMTKATTGDDGSVTLSITVKSTSSGLATLTGNAAEVNNIGTTVVSLPRTIQVNDPTPTGTPVPTATIVPSPVPSSLPTVVPSPVFSPTPVYPTGAYTGDTAPVVPDNPSPVPSVVDAALGVSDLLATPTPTLPPSQWLVIPPEDLPIIFIVAGIIILSAPFIIVKFSHLRKYIHLPVIRRPPKDLLH